MKLIIAIIWPEKLEAVQGAFDESEACLMSVSQVSSGQALVGSYRGAEVRGRPPKLRLEIVVVNDRLVHEIVDAITYAGAMDGLEHLGNGHVFVMELDECVRIQSIRPEFAVV